MGDDYSDDDFASVEPASEAHAVGYGDFHEPLTMPGIGVEYQPEEGDVEAHAALEANDMTYDYPGEPPSPDGNLGHSAASLGLGTSSGALPEEINIETHGLIDETMQRLSCIQGVLGVLIVDREGRIVRATMPLEEAARLSGPTLELLQRARTCIAINSDDELRMLCVRTRKYEMMLCSEMNGSYGICCIQDASPADSSERAEHPASSATRSVLRAAVGTVF